MKELYDFLNDLAEADSEAAQRETLTRHLAALDMSCFAYVNMGRHAAPPYYTINTFPEAWVTRYQNENYIEQDLVIQVGRRSFLPFRWRPLINLPKITPMQKRIFEEARDHGLCDGLALPIQGVGLDFAILSIASPERDFPRAMEAHKHLVHLMALHFHATIEARLHPSSEPPSETVSLSPREIECLKWISKGKTAWEISQILRISERTVVYHVENAKRKLEVNTRNHAIVKAITLGLIEP